jgi:hypothetical protein
MARRNRATARVITHARLTPSLAFQSLTDKRTENSSVSISESGVLIGQALLSPTGKEAKTNDNAHSLPPLELCAFNRKRG